AGETILGIQSWIVADLGWYYMLVVGAFVAFAIVVGVSKYGKIKLGKDEDEPEFGILSWFAMLFAAGIGSILMFWGVAEPVSHLGDPPRASTGIEPGTVEAAADAMNFTYYHFTLHTWTIFTLPALCFAYFI
ncbi:BCCT family transporter, partial [Burkholderia multivorans]